MNLCILARHAGIDVVSHPEGENTAGFLPATVSPGGEGNHTYDAASDAEDLTDMEGNCVFDEIVEPLAQGTLKAIRPLISRYLSGTVSWLCEQEREKSR